MDGMETAVRRLKQAVEDKERIVIYGDYDVDGITSRHLFIPSCAIWGHRRSFISLNARVKAMASMKRPCST